MIIYLYNHMNNHILDILTYLTPNQLENLYNRNLDFEINNAILKLRKEKLINEQIRVIEEINVLKSKLEQIQISKIPNNLFYETKDSLEASQYVVHGCNVTYDEKRKVYLIKDNK